MDAKVISLANYKNKRRINREDEPPPPRHGGALRPPIELVRVTAIGQRRERDQAAIAR
jgi:hypothetical protein